MVDQEENLENVGNLENMESPGINDIGTFSGFFNIRLPLKSDLYKKLDFKIDLKPNLTEELMSLKAELRVCTFIQYGFETNIYDKFSKSHFEIPKPYLRELNRVSALFESADKSLNGLLKKMNIYESNYGAYIDNITKEIERLEIGFREDKNNIDYAYKIAQLARNIRDWDKVRSLLEKVIKMEEWDKVPNIKSASILRDLGMAICKICDPSDKRYKEGQKYIESAIERNPNDSDALSALGTTYKKQNKESKAHKFYKRALEVDPGDPYSLGNYLIYEIQKRGNLDPISQNFDKIEKSIQKRLDQIEVYVDIVWAFFDIGTFSLFLGDTYRCLKSYIMAIRFSPDIELIKITLDTIDRTKNVHDQVEGIDFARHLLMMGIAFHPSRSNEKNREIYNEIIVELDKSMKIMEKNLEDSIVIFAGVTDAIVGKKIQGYRDEFIESFKDFKGSIISGGTKRGIAGLVGDIQKHYPETIKSVGYLPKDMPEDIEIDKMYTRIHTTNGKDFSILEVLQYWYDILKSGIETGNIKLIGINGGKISALEFRMAIVFGAQVGILDESGRASSELIRNPWWIERDQKGHTLQMKQYKTIQPKRLFKVIKNKPREIQNFLTKPFIVDPDIENLRKLIFQDTRGVDIYQRDFSTESMDNSLLAGIISALDTIGKELNMGQTLSIKFKNGYLTGGFFPDMSLKIIFVLFGYPSEALEKKITSFILQLEKKLGKEIIRVCKTYEVLEYGSGVEDILEDIFGSEILKLL
ncbi:MAG: tetratricopeptide repeat protein [archaeon]|nr:tetratricopeptide repeat protein [archaeon]